VTIPQTNFNPPFNITRASHLVFTARDLAASRDFYVEVMGLIVSDEDANTIWLRGVEERCHHSLTLKRTTGQPQCERVGFRVFTDEDLGKAKAHFDRTGISAAFVEFRIRAAPCIFPIRPARRSSCARPCRRARACTPRFTPIAAPARCGWTTIRCWCRTCWCREVLHGSRLPDFRLHLHRRQRARGGTFLHRKDNPWDIVLLTRSGPRFHHGGYVIEALEDMIRACDVAGNLGFGDRIEHGPGRQDISIPIISMCAIRTDTAPN
jgi:catechol 2,3-dioxygenase